jgi:O-antigen/teichoic acid export membrane protein
MASDRYSKLLKNSLVFFIGNLGSKIISFVIVPFYTYVLTTEEYGSADLITTTVNMLAPFVMVGMNEAVLRFTVSKDENVGGIATNSLAVVTVGSVVSWLLFPLFASISIIGDNVVLFLLLLTLTCFNNVFLQLLRGIGKSKSFAFNGVLITFSMAAANVIALGIFHLGVKGYLASMLAAQAIGALHIIVSCKLWRLVSFKALDRQLTRRMLVYCIPLIPNSLMWWIMSASDRYVILFFLGAGANGIYNVAQKIPSIVNIVYGIFMQAWQISAIEERDSEDNARFQSTVFRYIFVILALASSLIAASSYPVYTRGLGSLLRCSPLPTCFLV